MIEGVHCECCVSVISPYQSFLQIFTSRTAEDDSPELQPEKILEFLSPYTRALIVFLEELTDRGTDVSTYAHTVHTHIQYIHTYICAYNTYSVHTIHTVGNG